MAKNDVNINMNIDDNGDLNKLDKKARKAGKGLEKGAKGAHSMDRRLRGAAAMSSSSTKNFSKMSQGISGGLVPAYATLAASLFAIDAAFRALKRASDLRVQRQGMEAYAATTGVALKSIARDLQAATGYQLDFKEAAESTSIAISAGFSADQITAIGSAARTASIALGRDFADSYQRLLKGITKAEPELLDELGIILRLEKATKVYAATIGKTAQDLTAYERQQAVFNEVIDQVADKYAAVGDAIPVSVMGQLGAKMTDLTDSFLSGIAPIAEFFGSVLVNSTTAAIAALGMFAASILKNVIPSLDVMMSKATAAWAAAKGQGRAAWGSFKGIGSEFGNAKRIMTGTPKKGLSGAQAMAKGGMKGAKGAGMESLRKGGGLTKAQLTGLKKSLKHAEKQWADHGAVVSGNLAGMNIKNVRSMQTSLKMMETSHIKFFTAVKVGYKALATTAVLAFRTIRAAWASVAASMRVVATGLGVAMNKALGIIGWIGMLFMAKDMFAEMGNSWDKILKSIGGFIQKIGDWIERLGKKLGPDSAIGKFIAMAGATISAGGTIVIERGESMADQMESRRRAAAFAGQAEGAAQSFTDRTTEVQQQKERWKSMSGLKGWEQGAAENQMLASAGGIQDFANLRALTDRATALGKTVKDQAFFDRPSPVTGAKLTEAEMEETAAGGRIGGKSNWQRLKESLFVKKEGEGYGKFRSDEHERPETKAEAGYATEMKEAINVKETFETMTESIKKTKPAMVAHYRELEKTDSRYKLVADAIEGNDYEAAKVELIKLTNAYGSHVQALKDMKSAEEGRNKRVAEYFTKTQELSKRGNEIKTLATSLGELKGTFSESDLKYFREFYGEEATKGIENLAQAREFANKQLAKQLELTEKIRNAKGALAAAELGVAHAAGGAGLFRQKAAEIAKVQSMEVEYLVFQRDQLDNTANNQKKLDALNAKKVEDLTALDILNIQIHEAEIARVDDLIEAKRVGLETERQMITDVGKLRQSFKESFVDGMQKGIEGLIMGTKSLKEAFADMAKGILASMAKVLAELMTQKLLGSMFGDFFSTGGIKATGGTGTNRYGGIMSPPGYRSFAEGGIATGSSGKGYGATLHGTEAVVPLPNDRSIPVTLSGSTGATNNTSVIVNVAEGGTSSELSGESKGQALGGVIAMAIEERLQDEQRPGGILYRPGGG